MLCHGAWPGGDGAHPRPGVCGRPRRPRRRPRWSGRRRGTDDPSVARVWADQAEHLQRLAEAHVVGQHPAQAVLARGTPASGTRRAGRTAASDTTPVGSAAGGRSGRERLGPADPLGGLRVDHAELGELLPAAEVVGPTLIRSPSGSRSSPAARPGRASWANSGRSVRKKSPLGRNTCSCPRVIAASTAASGSGSPSTVIVTQRSSQSCRRRRRRARARAPRSR